MAAEAAPMVPTILATLALMALATLQVAMWPLAAVVVAPLRAVAALLRALLEQIPPPHPAETAPAGAQAE